MDNFYTSEGSFTFNNNDGVMSVEFSYNDSDNNHCASYQEGTDILTLFSNIFEDIEDQLAEADDTKADYEEIANIEGEIAKLNDRLTELKARTKDLNDYNNIIDKSLKEEDMNLFSKTNTKDKKNKKKTTSYNDGPHGWLYGSLLDDFPRFI